VVTGGFSSFIAKETSVFDVIDPDLVLTGLRLVYYMNRG